MKKKLTVGVLAFVCVLALGVVFLGRNVDSFLKNAIERYASQAAGAQTTLVKAELSLADGRGVLEGFKIANPKGFSEGNFAVSFDKILVQIDPSSLAGNGPIVIQALALSTPKILYEIAKDGTNNLGTIQRNVATYARSFKDPKEEALSVRQVGNPEKPARKIVIDSLSIEGGAVRVDHALIADKSIELVLPSFALQGLGRNAGGIDPAVIAQIVVTQITSKIMTLSKGAIVDKLREQGASSLKEAFKESDVGQALGDLLGK